MASYTPNLNLKKPAVTDTVAIADLNGNMDILDTAVEGKQNVLIFDSTPTQSSTNPVTSGGVYTALSGKENTLNTDQKRKITISTADPTGGSDGDIWLKYTA